MLILTPINLKTANAFVQQHHRHHKPTRGHKFSIGVSDNGALVGVAICGRPVARRLDDGYTLEVNRLCTNGTPNACSILYAAAYRAARAMGYNKVVTYILDTENGSSLKAAGYTCEGRAGGLEWNGAKAPKQADQYPHSALLFHQKLKLYHYLQIHRMCLMKHNSFLLLRLTPHA